MNTRLVAKRRSALSHPANFLVRVAEKAKNSVVAIRTYPHPTRRTSSFALGSRQDDPENVGTGFVIHPDGIILTSQHVTRGSSEIRVCNAVGREFLAKTVWKDQKRDLCILKISCEKRLTPILWGSSKRCKIGEIVISVGNPLNLGQSVSTGVISGIKRSIEYGETSIRNLIQTDCAVNPGSSGGPLINLNGEVIGMNSFIAQDLQRVGFAIGIDSIRQSLSKVRFMPDI